MIEISEIKFDIKTVEVSGEVSEPDVQIVNSEVGLEKLRVYGDALRFLSKTKINNRELRWFGFSQLELSLLDVVELQCINRAERLIVGDSPGVFLSIDPKHEFLLLENLTICGQTLVDHEISFIREKKDLKSLGLFNTNLTDNSLLEVTRNNSDSLRWLLLANTSVALSSVFIVGFPNLVDLCLTGTSITDESVDTIRTFFPSLKRLGILETSLSHASVKRLSEWEQLDVLHTDYKDLAISKTVGPYASYE